jgi:hypothetical protein
MVRDADRGDTVKLVSICTKKRIEKGEEDEDDDGSSLICTESAGRAKEKEKEQ